MSALHALLVLWYVLFVFSSGEENTKKEEPAKTVSDDLAGLGESGSTFLLMHILPVNM